MLAAGLNFVGLFICDSVPVCQLRQLFAALFVAMKLQWIMSTVMYNALIAKQILRRVVMGPFAKAWKRTGEITNPAMPE
jgi:hypothetical protein